MIVQQIAQYPDAQNGSSHGGKIILFFSTRSTEGKTVLIGNIAQKMKKQGFKVLVLVFSRESLRRTELSQTGYSDLVQNVSNSGNVKHEARLTFIKRIFGYPDTRLDYDSPFLESPENYLDPEEFLVYQTDEFYLGIKNYQDLLRNNRFKLNFIPDYVLIEIPPILYYSYPPALIGSCDLSLLVCRANKTWSPADQGAVDTFMKLSSVEPLFLLNGVEIPVIETVLGDLPKKRNIFVRMLKKLIRFQFYERFYL
jgi:hypothetical protein